MNKMVKFTINSILGGQSPLMYQAAENQFLTSIGIDPDIAVDFGSSKVKTGGMITPTQYSTFSGANISGAPMWIITNPKDTNVYVYASDGKFVSYTNTFGSETLIGTPTSGAGNGGAYYNNYIYLFTPTNVSRYGPLSGTPSISNTFWTATLSKTATTNTTYPSYGSVSYPNHPAHVHVDNKLYFGDMVNGQGVIHYIKTKKTTDEGDTDDGSTYQALSLPFGYMPTDIESYGNDLVISAIQTNDTAIKQGTAALFFWDTTSPSFYRQVPISEPIIGALLNANGNLYVFSGNRNNGVSVGVYAGGYTIQPLDFFEEGNAPFAGAVDYYDSRVIWGGSTTYPVNSASIFARGYKHPRLPSGAINNIMKTGAASSSPTVSAVRVIQQASGIVPRVIAGWRSGSTYGLDKLDAAATLSSIFRSQIFNISQPFKIRKMTISLSDAVVSNVSITPKFYVDNESTTYTLAAINNTNYSGNAGNITYREMEMTSNGGGPIGGEQNFYLELAWGGTVHRSIILPIDIWAEILPV